MKRRCNICLQSRQVAVTTRFNDITTICYQCQAIIKRISSDDDLIYTSTNGKNGKL